MISTRCFLANFRLLVIFQLVLLFNHSLVYAAEGDNKAANTSPPATTQNVEQSEKGTTRAPGESNGASAESQIEHSMANINSMQQTLESLRNEIENSKESTSLNKGSVQSIKDGLDLMDKKLKDAYTELNQSRSGISGNTEKVDKLQQSPIVG